MKEKTLGHVLAALAFFCFLSACSRGPAELNSGQKARAETIRQEALSALEREDYSRAVKLYTEMEERKLVTCKDRGNRGTAFFHLREYGKARKDIEWALKFTKDNATLWFNRAVLDFHEGKYKDCEAACRKAESLDESFGAAASLRGVALEAQDYPDQAMVAMNKAIRVDDMRAESYANRAKLWLMWGLYDDAIADLNEAVYLSPENPAFRNDRGGCYVMRHQYEKALKDLNRAVEIDSEEPAFFYNRAVCYERMHDYELAIRDYTRVMVYQPDSADMLVYRGRLYIKLGRPVQGRADLEAASKKGLDGPLERYEQWVKAHGTIEDLDAFLSQVLVN